MAIASSNTPLATDPTSASSAAGAPGPLFIADNLALDFINTEYGVEPRRFDGFGDEKGVMDWLAQAGLLPEGVATAPKGLLPLARELRTGARTVVEAAKAGSPADTEVVNRVLELGRPKKELAWDSASASFKLVKQRQALDAAGLLEPVAEAIVKLLTQEPLELVRECEAHDCTLLFHDLTKSHRRRWCSMAACGNRMKVAAFRSRKKAA